jgi:uncharacterized membrane-anchored protein
MTLSLNKCRQLVGAIAIIGFIHAALAADTPSREAQQADRQAAVASAVKAMEAAQIKGPSDIKLRDQATIKLPAGYVWVPEPAASQFMKAVGNHPDERELGLIFPQAESEGWMVVATYEKSGYIKDDDAKNWNADDMLKSIQEGTEAANEERKSQGFPELEVLGWVEKPNYTADTHRLIWSMSARNKGVTAPEDTSINYNTYALGREGYITLNLITGLQNIGAEKHHAQTLLAALNFDDGKRYADYNSSTDKTAEYGLAALVGGLAAKKLGMFALAAGFFAKFAKVIVLAVAGVGAAARKFFKKDQA